MEDSDRLGAWGSLVVGLGAVIAVPYIYLVEDSAAANFAWYVHLLFAAAFLWGIYSALKGAGWLYGRLRGRDEGTAEYEATAWGCWGLAILIGGGFILFNWEKTSDRFASLSPGTGLILLGICGLGYLQIVTAKAIDNQFESIGRRLDALESALAARTGRMWEKE